MNDPRMDLRCALRSLRASPGFTAVAVITLADPLALGAVAIPLVAVALAAAYVPGRRAARINPTDALRRR